jgi:hypothetical protein
MQTLSALETHLENLIADSPESVEAAALRSAVNAVELAKTQVVHAMASMNFKAMFHE